MPELPEVETVARQLAPFVVGARVKDVLVHDALLGRRDFSRVRGARIAGVRRVGKQVVFDLIQRNRRKPSLFMAVHLRMTGRLIFGERTGGVASHLRAEIVCDKGRVLFIDPRRFGTIRLHDAPSGAGTSGIDPFDPLLSRERLGLLMQGSSQSLKAWLLRQDRLSGIGNIYAAEICHRAGLDPRRTAGSLKNDEVTSLLASARMILTKAILHCGTTFSDFQDVHGSVGGYQRYLKVYGRDGERCRRRGCPGTIERFVQQQRSTFFCPVCQR